MSKYVKNVQICVICANMCIYVYTLLNRPRLPGSCMHEQVHGYAGICMSWWVWAKAFARVNNRCVARPRRGGNAHLWRPTAAMARAYTYLHTFIHI